jgi:hypothetical protein
MHRILTPEAVAILVQFRNTQSRVPDGEATEAARFFLPNGSQRDF